MQKLFFLAVFPILVAHAAKVPRIYNVLISSKKNLSPSHAVPVYEPVLRTTSLGFAFPPFLYETTHPQYQPIQPLAYHPLTTVHPAGVIGNYPAYQMLQNPRILQNKNTEEAESSSTISHPVEQVVEYSPVHGLINSSQQGYYSPPPKQESLPEKKDKLLPIPANLKKNPEIPDVPPPPIPVKANQ